MMAVTGNYLHRAYACFAAILLASGCNSGPELARVWGEISLDGKSVEDGTIEFTPIEGTGGWVVGAVIKGGVRSARGSWGRVGGAYKFPLFR